MANTPEILNLDVHADRVSTAFEVAAFQGAIKAHGVKMVHYRGIRNPVGMIDKYDPRRPDSDNSGASNGMIYTKAGCFSALFIGNSKNVKAMEGGMLNAATAQITPTIKYDHPDEDVYLSPMDRIYLAEESILVPHQQLVEAHETGYDKLQFPVVKVLALIDANGKKYTESDYSIQNGQIHWCDGAGPSINPETGIGRIYSIKFLYRPYWYIDRLLHEIRVAQFKNPITGEHGLVKMNQSAIVQREYIFENEANDDLAEPSERQVKGPRDGGFGPR